MYMKPVLQHRPVILVVHQSAADIVHPSKHLNDPLQHTHDKS